MDSREAQSQPVPPGMMMGPNSYTPNMPNNNNSSMITPNSAANMMPNPRFPFNSVMSASSKPFDSLNNNNNTNHHNNSASQYDGSGGSGMVPCGFNMDQQQQQQQQQGKKKRGRPRKYSPDGGSNIALGLSPTPISPMGHEDCGSGGGGGAAGGPPSSEPSGKRNRGRPPGSGKKQLDALGPGGVGFTPHVITIQPGEDISSKIMAFSQEGPRTVCILSANGAICNVTLRQPAVSGGTVTYEGRFEIISLSGSFFLSESNGNRSRNGGLSISLASSDGRVLGGGVAGMLVAATPVQVIVGSFVAEGKKSNSNISASTPSSAAPPQMLNFGAPVAAASPPSHGGSSDSSDENGSSPLDRAGFGPYNNANQPIHSMPLYPSMNWGPPGMKIHPN